MSNLAKTQKSAVLKSGFKSLMWRLAILLCMVPVHAGSKMASPEILRVGSYHQDEIRTGNGDVWLGLFPRNGRGYELKRCTISVRPTYDAISDSHTGRDIRVLSPTKPLIMIRGVNTLKEGSVTTWVDNSSELNPGLNLQLGESQQLNASGRLAPSESGEMMVDYRLRLSKGESGQALIEEERVNGGPMPRLLWAGDLDGDNQADLIIDHLDSDGISNLTLFLSSMASQSDLAGIISEFQSAGF